MPADHLSTTFQALADPTRRAILARLALGETSVSELAEPFDISLPAVSRHLKVLEGAGLVERERQGREHLIAVRAAPLREVSEWVSDYERLWSTHLDRVEKYFKEKRKAK